MNIQERLQMVIKMHNLTASSFADKIGVQRSSVSHIMTGRNKPSLDFLEKTLKTFPRVNAHWLITGITKELDRQNSVEDSKLQSEVNNNLKNKENERKQQNKKVTKVIIFYDNNTFEER